MADALSTLPLHDSVWIRQKTGEESQVKDIEIDVDWEDMGTEVQKGCFAKVTVSFVTNFMLFKNCTSNMTIL